MWIMRTMDATRLARMALLSSSHGGHGWIGIYCTSGGGHTPADQLTGYLKLSPVRIFTNHRLQVTHQYQSLGGHAPFSVVRCFLERSTASCSHDSKVLTGDADLTRNLNQLTDSQQQSHLCPYQSRLMESLTMPSVPRSVPKLCLLRSDVESGLDPVPRDAGRDHTTCWVGLAKAWRNPLQVYQSFDASHPSSTQHSTVVCLSLGLILAIFTTAAS